MANVDTLVLQSYRVKTDDHFSAFVEVVPRNRSTLMEANDLEEKFNALVSKKAILDNKIDNLTSHADLLDYTLAACGGELSGIMDIFLVGEPGTSYLKKWSNQQTLGVVKKFAKMQGCDKTQDSKVISWLEDKYKVNYDFRGSGDIAQDYTYPKMHHLNSWAHHPTLLGLVCSIIDQFNNTTTFTSNIRDGVGGDIVILSGKAGDRMKLQGKTVPAKLIAGTMNWIGHLMSDVAGSNNSAGKGNLGAGIPGPIMATIYEVTSILRECKVSSGEFERAFLSTIEKMYWRGYDFRFELAQAIPVVVNDLLIRSLYIIRRTKAYLVGLRNENKRFAFSDFWEAVKPYKNRTLTRMLLVGEAVFTTIDVADAAIRSVGNWPKFLVRVNIVGVGKLIITGAGDVYAGIKKEKLRNERILLMNELIMVHQGTIEYRLAETWRALPNTLVALQQAELGILEQSRQSMIIYQEYEQAVQPKLNHEIKQLKRGEREALSNLLDI